MNVCALAWTRLIHFCGLLRAFGVDRKRSRLFYALDSNRLAKQIQIMETKHKELYDAPSTRVFEMKIEGVICQSGLDDPTDYIPGDDPFKF